MCIRDSFDAALVLEGEQWVTENIPGVKAMTTGFESIDIVLDYCLLYTSIAMIGTLIVFGMLMIAKLRKKDQRTRCV